MENSAEKNVMKNGVSKNRENLVLRKKSGRKRSELEVPKSNASAPSSDN